MEPVRASSGQNTLPGEILPTDQTLVADGRPPAVAPGGAAAMTGPFRIGRFTAVRQLGAGGMGVVFAGQAASGRAVAIKVMRGAGTREEGEQRFVREAQADDFRFSRIVVGIVQSKPFLLRKSP